MCILSQCASHHCIWGVLHTAETILWLICIQGLIILKILRSVHPTTKTISTACSTKQRQTFFLSKSTFYISNLFFHDRCVHPLKDFSFKSNQRQVKILILTLWCALCSLSPQCATYVRDCLTPRRWTLWCVANCRDHLRSVTQHRVCLHGVMHTV